MRCRCFEPLQPYSREINRNQFMNIGRYMLKLLVKKSLKKLNYIHVYQWVTFSVLFCLSLIFYHERLLADSGYYLMRMINYQMPWIEHGRYILLFSQLLPWLGVSLHLHLKVVLILFSINHVLFHFLIFYLSVYRFKNLMAGVFIILLQVAGLVTGFMVPMFELYYAASMLVLFAVILFSKKINTVYLWILMFLAFFIMSSHPMGIFMLIVVVGFYGLDFGMKGRRIHLYLGVLLAGLLLFKFFTASEYESGKTSAILQNLNNGKYNEAYFSGLGHFLFKNYFSIAILAVIVSLLITYQKAYRKLLLYLSAILLVIALSILNTGTFDFSRYNEQVWFPLVFVVCFPLMTISGKIAGRKLSVFLYVLLVLFTVYRLWMIAGNGLLYTQRTNTMRQVVEHAQQYESRKFIVNDSLLTKGGVPGPNWSYPIETMFISAEKGKEYCISICTTEDYYFNDVYKQLDTTNYLFRRFEVEPLTNLNSFYFRLDSGNYQSIHLPNKDN